MASFRKKTKILLKLENPRINRDQMLRFSFCWTNSTISRTSTATDLNFHLKWRKIKIQRIPRKIVKRSLLKFKHRFKMKTTVLTRQFSQPWVQLETLTRKMSSRIKKDLISQPSSSMPILWTIYRTINSHKVQIRMYTKKLSHLWKEIRCFKITCRQIFRTYKPFSKTSESKGGTSRLRTKIKWR